MWKFKNPAKFNPSTFSKDIKLWCTKMNVHQKSLCLIKTDSNASSDETKC